MIGLWPFLPAIVGYLVVAMLVGLFGASLVGDSAAGRKAVPLVALFWPLALWVLVVIGVIAAIDAAFEEAIDRTFGRPKAAPRSSTPPPPQRGK